jgi:hypothetical protein
MKRKDFLMLVILFLGGMGLAGQAMGQTHSVQSTAPALQMPVHEAPVNPDPETGRDETRSRTSDAIGGSVPVEATLPSTTGTVQNTAAEIVRPLSPAELEEMEDGK